MKNMYKGKNLLILAVVAGGAYYYWMKMKKDKAAKAAAAKAAATAAQAENGFTGSYFNATGLPYVNAAAGVVITPKYGTTFNQSVFAARHQNAPSWATNR